MLFVREDDRTLEFHGMKPHDGVRQRATSEATSLDRGGVVLSTILR